MYKGAASWAGSAAACFTNTWICRAHYWSNWVDTIWSGSLSKNFTGVCQPFFQPSSPKKWAGQNQQMCLLGTSFGRFLSFSKLEFVNVRPCKRASYAHCAQSLWKCAKKTETVLENGVAFFELIAVLLYVALISWCYPPNKIYLKGVVIPDLFWEHNDKQPSSLQFPLILSHAGFEKFQNRVNVEQGCRTKKGDNIGGLAIYYVDCFPYYMVCSTIEYMTYLGRIHLVLNKTLTDDTSIKRAQIKTFFCLI